MTRTGRSCTCDAQALIDRIHLDAQLSRVALAHSTLSAHAQDPFLAPAKREQLGRGGAGIAVAGGLVRVVD